MKRILIISFCLIMSACTKESFVQQEAPCALPEVYNSSSHPKSADLQRIIDKYKRLGLPGIALIIRDAEGTWTGAVGYKNLREQQLFSSCTVSKNASITKLYMSVLCMRLVELGVLDLDDFAASYLDGEYATKVNNLESATIRQLLNHTSGIYDMVSDQTWYLNVLNNPDKLWEPDELIKYAYHDDPYFSVGADVKYSNSNFLILSMVIDEIGSRHYNGKKHDELLKELVIEPLFLEDVYYNNQLKGFPEHLAHGYFDLHNNGTILNLTDWNTGSGNGYGGMYTTVESMLIFLESVFRNPVLLSEESLVSMQEFNAELDEDRELGLGLMKDFLDRGNDFAIGHRGRDLAYSGDLFWFPERDISYCFLVNYGTNGESELQQVFFDFREELVDLLLN